MVDPCVSSLEKDVIEGENPVNVEDFSQSGVAS